MITIFNRKELCGTISTEEEGHIRSILSQAGIPYSIKVVDQGAGNFLGSTRRSSLGSLGVNLNCTKNYTFFVKRQDYEKAWYLLRQMK